MIDGFPIDFQSCIFLSNDILMIVGLTGDKDLFVHISQTPILEQVTGLGDVCVPSVSRLCPV